MAVGARSAFNCEARLDWLRIVLVKKSVLSSRHVMQTKTSLAFFNGGWAFGLTPPESDAFEQEKFSTEFGFGPFGAIAVWLGT